jgi:hypothetical protein
MEFLINRARHILAGMVLVACAAMPQSAQAVITFDAEGGTIQSSMTVQAIVPMSGGGYRMYLSSEGYRILSATSTDQAGWSPIESGVRLSTSATAGVDSSSITSLGIFIATNSADNFMRMYYVGVSSVGYYRILSATSAWNDGLTWVKETSTHVIKNNGLGFLDSPRPFAESTSLMRLYYVTDNAGLNTPANYRVYTASSNDGGLTFTDDGVLLTSDVAYQVSVTTLTDGRTRLYYSAPLTGETTGSQVLSAIAASGSQSFASETGVRHSTSSSSAELTYPVVIRTTETFRWRMYHSFTPSGSTIPYVTSAFTSSPTIISFSPTTMEASQSQVDYTVTGEIFSLSPAVTFFTGGDTLTATTVNRTNDLELTGSMNPLGKAIGSWTATVTNADGAAHSLTSAFRVTLPPAEITMVDNLFRPNSGGQVSASVKTFGAGHVTIRLYTSSGQLIKTLVDEDAPAGTTSTSWNGRTLSGHVAASGVYLLHINAPGADVFRKVVIIK